MWITHCSRQTGFVTEHHSAKTAREDLLVHILGSKALGWEARYPTITIVIPPCEGEHSIEDNGVPCDYRGCTKPYIREDGRYQYVV